MRREHKAENVSHDYPDYPGKPEVLCASFSIMSSDIVKSKDSIPADQIR